MDDAKGFSPPELSGVLPESPCVRLQARNTVCFPLSPRSVLRFSGAFVLLHVYVTGFVLG